MLFYKLTIWHYFPMVCSAMWFLQTCSGCCQGSREHFRAAWCVLILKELGWRVKKHSGEELLLAALGCSWHQPVRFKDWGLTSFEDTLVKNLSLSVLSNAIGQNTKTTTSLHQQPSSLYSYQAAGAVNITGNVLVRSTPLCNSSSISSSSSSRSRSRSSRGVD